MKIDGVDPTPFNKQIIRLQIRDMPEGAFVIRKKVNVVGHFEHRVEIGRRPDAQQSHRHIAGSVFLSPDCCGQLAFAGRDLCQYLAIGRWTGKLILDEIQRAGGAEEIGIGFRVDRLLIQQRLKSFQIDGCRNCGFFRWKEGCNDARWRDFPGQFARHRIGWIGDPELAV